MGPAIAGNWCSVDIAHWAQWQRPRDAVEAAQAQPRPDCSRAHRWWLKGFPASIPRGQWSNASPPVPAAPVQRVDDVLGGIPPPFESLSSGSSFPCSLIPLGLKSSILTTTYETLFLRKVGLSMQIDTLWVRCRSNASSGAPGRGSAEEYASIQIPSPRFIRWQCAGIR